MVGDLHQTRLDYAKKYFENYEGGKWHFREIRIENLAKNLIEISGKSKGIVPDLVMIWHNYLEKDFTDLPIELPSSICICWIEVFVNSFRTFPKRKELLEALIQSITLRDLYEPEQIKSSILAGIINTRKDLSNYLRNHCNIHVDFYLVQDDSIWECKQID